ncbi:hypothetical protein GUITHDRAFT_107826 [Guillardia theta CCMP2712]|uniref:Uncharacterized protein n=2 Tax=Guillardia theta TaxID=55529 RepID=L1JCD4_GUITC|nr:hypothetical protein GUITHDRAFT_107826 [Guillardia theta CCMP2712]EKX46208.1 hypothetical protein GUITHDRAFT_107826 [Guillardia theta CCMP2712]|mmetsp:Transcript_12485/g.43400  ORF Transcript_12485/g.43400 Transcript_12485/m.43400 type:complete len:111 (+) Transcript_12485:1435-1767(+)|eukprot:XP_005833188.1 hypothetical protein GUITHDRAFT_107826 [Guillardia theta CCMP2712]
MARAQKKLSFAVGAGTVRVYIDLGTFLLRSLARLTDLETRCTLKALMSEADGTYRTWAREELTASSSNTSTDGLLQDDAFFALSVLAGGLLGEQGNGSAGWSLGLARRLR